MKAPEEFPEVTAVVPTIGRSPWLEACLEALRAQQGVRGLEILVVDQAPGALSLPPGLADRVLRPERNLGFAGGTNFGIAAAAGSEFVATVNDDAIVGPGWLATLAAALRDNPRAAAAQGLNLLGTPVGHRAADVWTGAGAKAAGLTDGSDRAALIDGCGLAWNRWWQAIQLGHGESAPPAEEQRRLPAQPPPAVVEVFGVSATAALFRRAALERVALGDDVFDPRLISYYEDAELAGRLRAAGFSALLAPAARAFHAGSTSASTAAGHRWRLMYGNRYLAAARLLGRGLWPRLPAMMLRDGVDLIHVLGSRGGAERLGGMVAGWGRALRLLPSFAHRGAPRPRPAEVAQLSRLVWLAQARRSARGTAALPRPPVHPG